MSNGFNFTNVLLLLIGMLFIISGYYDKSLKDILKSILSGNINGVFTKSTTAVAATAGSSGHSGLTGGGGFGGTGGGSW